MGQLGQLKPGRGFGLPQLGTGSSGAVEVGAIFYGVSAPDASWLEADGAVVRSSDYPDLARKLANFDSYPSGAAIFSPGTVPISTTINTLAISDNGKRILCHNGNNTAYQAMHYLVRETDLLLAGQSGSNSTSEPRAPAIYNDGTYVFTSGTTTATVQIISAAGVGLPAYTSPNPPRYMEWSADGKYVIGWCNASIFVATYNGASLSLKGNYTNIGGAIDPAQITRNMEGTRYAWAIGGAGTSNATGVSVADFKDGVFTVVPFTLNTGSIGAGGTIASVSMTPDGKWICVGYANAMLEFYKEDAPGAGYKYFSSALAKAPTINVTFKRALFTPDGQYIFRMGYGNASTTICKFDDGLISFVEPGESTYPAAGLSGVFFGATFSRTGRAVLAAAGSSAPYVQAFLAPAAQPLLIPLPRVAGYGPIGQRLKAFIKVRP